MGVKVEAVIPCPQELKIETVAKIRRFLEEICQDKPEIQTNSDGQIKFTVNYLKEWDGNYHQETRRLNVYICCDEGYQELTSNQTYLLLSLTKWGHAEEIIYELGKKLAAEITGVFYYIANDSQDVQEVVEVEIIPPKLQYRVINQEIILDEAIPLNRSALEQFQLHLDLNVKYSELFSPE